MLDSEVYLSRLIRWLNVLPQFLRTSPAAPGLMWYGTGESAHWPVQSNMNVCAALAVMAADPDFECRQAPLSRSETAETALALLRYALRTHLTGDLAATDGKSWGHSWISVLGAERMAHGINALEPWLTPEDRERYRVFRLSEADWLLNEHPVVAGIDAAHNRPESNLWNGGFLLRTALDYPDSPRAESYRDKAAAFLLNAISIPADRHDRERFRGRPGSDWFAGANFTENYALGHHGYLNIGYMVICLSNVAMLHFNFRERRQTPPPELYRHVADLWQIVRQFIFPDGRLLRIGGDTRARYTYCQCYAIPMFLLAAEHLGDTGAAVMEQKWLEVIATELDYNGDGSSYRRRLAELGRQSWYYFTRLESDAVLCLSCGARWRRLFEIPQPAAPAPPIEAGWAEPLHGAAMIRRNGVVRAWVQNGAQGGTGLCVPLACSSMAEWQGNLNGQIIGHNVVERELRSRVELFPDGFLFTGRAVLAETLPLGEGETDYAVAAVQTAAAALSDGKTLLVAQRCVVTKEVTLYGIRSLHLAIPNDVFNGFRRVVRGKHFRADLTFPDHPAEIIDTREQWLSIDDCIDVFLLSGGKSLHIVRDQGRNIRMLKPHPPELTSLYAEIFCIDAVAAARRWQPGEILFDVVFAVAAACSAPERAVMGGAVEIRQNIRRIRFTGADGRSRMLAATYAGDDALPQLEFAGG